MLRITDNRTTPHIIFDDLQVGEVFKVVGKDDGDTYLKICPEEGYDIPGHCCNAVSLSNFRVVMLKPSIGVVPVNSANLIIDWR